MKTEKSANLVNFESCTCSKFIINAEYTENTSNHYFLLWAVAFQDDCCNKLDSLIFATFFSDTSNSLFR